MNPERWPQIDMLFQACLELERERRTAFLNEACADDLWLRERVEALLASDAQSWNFIESPALELAAALVAEDPPRLAPGQRLAHYAIVELIGRGGMGEVYLAKDEILNRSIALKFLTVEHTKDEVRLLRFQREAQAASALNHPNILTVHQLGDVEGQQFIATELIEGETLRKRIARGPLELRDALEVAIQTASALAAAHRAGIVHRDIKPENIMLRPDGYVKVLDFGLAKLAEQYDPPSHAQPVDRIDASSGLVMGTVRYMSPEQARGLQVDARSDIFSLGVVLYEMIAGRPPFENEDAAMLAQSILQDDPPSLARYLQPLPNKLAAIIHKTLSKERENRYQQAEHLLVDLKLLKDELDLEAKLLGREVRSLPGTEAASVTEPGTPPKESRSTKDSFSSSATSTLEYVISATRRPSVIIALVILLSAVSLAGYLSYKSIRQTRANSTTPPSFPTGTWTTKAPISSPRYQAEPAVLNGVLYIAGGWNVCTPYANLESYDPVSDTWTQRAPMLAARGNHGVGVLNGLLYAVGGGVDCGVAIASVEAYDPLTDTWSPKAPLPTTRVGHVVAVANDKLYAIGGVSNRKEIYALNTEYDPATNTWTNRAPLPTPRYSAAAAVVDDIIYVIGGSGGGKTLNAVEAYNPATNTWTSKAPMLSERVGFAASVINGIIYAFGGSRNSREVEAYDPATDTWARVAQMPAPRTDFHAAAFEGSIYFAGGFDGVSYLSSVLAFTPDLIPSPRPTPCPASNIWTNKAPMPTARATMAVGEINGIIYVAGGQEGDAVMLANNEAYDPVADKWTAKARMPTARSLRGTNNAVVNGRLYVIGGNPRGECTNVNEAYDPATDSWTTRAPMPTARCHVAVVAIGGLIYAIGGNTNTAFTSIVEVYNPTTNTWTTAPSMPTARQEVAAGVINGILYAAGGFAQYGSLNALEAYDPATRTWTTKASMPTSRNGSAAGVLNGSLIVVGGENDGASVTTVEAYDPASDTWTTQAPMPTARTALAAFTMNNTLYALGGGSTLSFVDLPTNEAYAPLPCSGQR